MINWLKKFKHRRDIIAINSTSSLDDAMDLIANEKVSKIPVYKESVDNILGILYAKDIIPYLSVQDLKLI